MRQLSMFMPMTDDDSSSMTNATSTEPTSISLSSLAGLVIEQTHDCADSELLWNKILTVCIKCCGT